MTTGPFRVFVLHSDGDEQKITGEEIVGMLRHAGMDIPRDAHIEVYVQVPGGGDWSNMSLDVDEECPVRVRWQTQKTETTDG